MKKDLRLRPYKKGIERKNICRRNDNSFFGLDNDREIGGIKQRQKGMVPVSMT